MAKEDADEESPESGEEANDEPMTPDEAQSLLIDAEVLVRMGAERIDALTEAGYLDKKTRDAIDVVWNTLLAKVEADES